MKASLNIDSSRNTVLHNAEAQVSLQHLDRADVELWILMRCVLQVKLTVFPERREAQYAGVPWWIIVLTILLLLLLGLLACFFWKVGRQRNPSSAN